MLLSQAFTDDAYIERLINLLLHCHVYLLFKKMFVHCSCRISYKCRKKVLQKSVPNVWKMSVQILSVFMCNLFLTRDTNVERLHWSSALLGMQLCLIDTEAVSNVFLLTYSAASDRRVLSHMYDSLQTGTQWYRPRPRE